jgi:hypothetical protein
MTLNQVFKISYLAKFSFSQRQICFKFPDDSDITLLEAVVGATNTKQEEGEEHNGADNQQDFKFSDRVISN